jgi:Family of unknown function (DUF5706)
MLQEIRSLPNMNDYRLGKFPAQHDRKITLDPKSSRMAYPLMPVRCTYTAIALPLVATDESWKLLEHVNEWLRFADAKAGAILAASGVLGGLMLSSIPTRSKALAHPLNAVLILIALAGIAASSLLTLRVLAPRLRTGEARSLVYFDHIARRYQSERNAFVDNYLSLANDGDGLARQLTEQIWANSLVARRKFRQVSYATRFLGLSMFSCGCAVLIQRVWNR